MIIVAVAAAAATAFAAAVTALLFGAAALAAATVATCFCHCCCCWSSLGVQLLSLGRLLPKPIRPKELVGFPYKNEQTVKDIPNEWVARGCFLGDAK